MKKTLFFLMFIAFSISCEKENQCVENLKEDCFCNYVYDPVCGCNDKTYGNACAAECHGITDYTKGKCP